MDGRAISAIVSRLVIRGSGRKEVKVFRDKEGIESGDNWRLKIKRALATSKYLVPILLPSYFHSEWYTKEIAAIYHRK
ncbi:MAG: toll/interleukin-1 receptor domain-containing protein [Cytophagales bacterium]|nr:toll/interleukin-1 receptor domain-containing protein [Cytophagales bacterium]